MKTWILTAQAPAPLHSLTGSHHSLTFRRQVFFVNAFLKIIFQFCLVLSNKFQDTG